MSDKVSVDLTFGYTDETNRKLTVSSFDSNYDSDDLKARILDFNQSGVSVISSLFLSDGGASCTGIVDAAVSYVTSTPVWAKTPELLMQALRRGEPNDVTS